MAGIKTDLAAIAVTATAKSASSAKGADMAGLINQALIMNADLTRILKQIVAYHPSGGADAANFTTLNNAITNYLS
jgi:hypothetical protein